MATDTGGSFVVAGIGIAQRSAGSAETGQVEGVVPVQANMTTDERRQRPESSSRTG
ncbi:hypothetical protein OHB12_07920 [Nocardia sp. NBC_01730]|uniref:hypothetical protein n=1 Tax=Nocardia sp. NBC_01730 TaxID=2975998 RepID=UPI002E0D91A0|nr:hypothetical protein OHB12_07920 [Nocardia sp. NBC_01730]